MKLRDNKTALLLIDMQNGFYHPDSQMGQNVGVEDRQETVPVIKNLINFARENNFEVFWSKQIHFPNDVNRSKKILKGHTAKQKFTPCLKNTFEIDIYDQLKSEVADSDHIIEKHRASLFFDTNLPTKLRMLNIRNLVIAGCNTEFCIAHTVRDAYAHDYEIIVVKDAVAGIDPKLHKSCLEIFQAYFAEVLPLKELKELFK